MRAVPPGMREDMLLVCIILDFSWRLQYKISAAINWYTSFGWVQWRENLGVVLLLNVDEMVRLVVLLLGLFPGSVLDTAVPCYFHLWRLVTGCGEQQLLANCTGEGKHIAQWNWFPHSFCNWSFLQRQNGDWSHWWAALVHVELILVVIGRRFKNLFD